MILNSERPKLPKAQTRLKSFKTMAGHVNIMAKNAVKQKVWPEFTNHAKGYDDLPPHWQHLQFDVWGKPMHMTTIPANPNRSFKGTIIYVAGLDSTPHDNLELNSFLADEGYALCEFDIAHPRKYGQFVELSAEMVRSIISRRNHPAAQFIDNSQGPVFLMTHSTGGMLSTKHHINPLLRSKIDARFGAGIIHLCCFFNSPSTRPGRLRAKLYRDFYIPRNAHHDFGSLWFDLSYGIINRIKGERVVPSPDARAITHGELDVLFGYADQVRDQILKRHIIPIDPTQNSPVTYIGARQDPSADHVMIEKVASKLCANFKSVRGWHRPIEDPRYCENLDILLQTLRSHTLQWRERQVTTPTRSANTAQLRRFQAA